ncbi:MAG: hypothetical protein GY855_02460 [candidate division Zixibacteria bacterium]|nr:hypothetical protein [candidate division Zixibacteria bacterium]
MRKFVILIAIITAVMFLAGNATAGYIIKSKADSESTTPMGKQSETSISISYIENDKIKNFDESKNTAIIMRMDKKIVYNIDYNKKTYQEITIDELKKKTESVMDMESPEMKERMKGMPPEQQAMMQNMMKEMISSIKVEKTGKTKDILGYKCSQYIVKKSGSKMVEMWSTEDLEYNNAFSDYMSLTMPGGQAMMDEFKKMKGLPLETNMSMQMMGVENKSLTTATEIKKTDVKDSEFEIPEGFKKEAFILQ